jgi:hypothetical protein
LSDHGADLQQTIKHVVFLLSCTHFVMGTFYCYTFLLLSILWYTVSNIRPLSLGPTWGQGKLPGKYWVGGSVCKLQDYVIYFSFICKYHFTLHCFGYSGCWPLTISGAFWHLPTCFTCIRCCLSGQPDHLSAWCFLQYCSSIYCCDAMMSRQQVHFLIHNSTHPSLYSRPRMKLEK